MIFNSFSYEFNIIVILVLNLQNDFCIFKCIRLDFWKRLCPRLPTITTKKNKKNPFKQIKHKYHQNNLNDYSKKIF